MHRAYRMLAKQLCKKQWNGGTDRMIMDDIKIMEYCIKCRQKRIDHGIQNLLFKCKNPLDPDALFQISIMPLLPASVVHGYLMPSGCKSGGKFINYHLLRLRSEKGNLYVLSLQFSSVSSLSFVFFQKKNVPFVISFSLFLNRILTCIPQLPRIL